MRGVLQKHYQEQSLLCIAVRAGSLSLPSLQSPCLLHLPCPYQSVLHLPVGHNQTYYLCREVALDRLRDNHELLHASYENAHDFPNIAVSNLLLLWLPYPPLSATLLHGQNMRISCYFMYQQNPLLLR